MVEKLQAAELLAPTLSVQEIELYNAAILGVRKGHVCVCVHVPRKRISVLDSI